MNYFFTADTHFGHEAILSYDGRPFSSIEEHDETIIQNWNAKVGKGDLVFHLGDFCFSPKVKTFEILRRLNGKIFLALGNHDDKVRRDPILYEAFPDVEEVYWWKAPDGQWVFMSHYPHLSWRNSHYGSWHLFGHVHGKLKHPNKEQALDVGIMLHGYAPIAYEELGLISDTSEE